AADRHRQGRPRDAAPRAGGGGVSSLCVLGAGTMGRGIAACGLAAGFETTLVAGLRLSTELDAAADADAVVEAVPELPDLKRDVFARLGRVARPGALLA